MFSANIIPLQIGYGIKREKSKLTLGIGGWATKSLELPSTMTGKTKGEARRGGGEVAGVGFLSYSIKSLE